MNESTPLMLTLAQVQQWIPGARLIGEPTTLITRVHTDTRTLANGDLFVQKASAVTIERLARAVLAVMDRPDHPVRIIGTRHGEKQFETLLSREEMALAEDRGAYFRVAPDNRDLNYDAYVRDGEERVSRQADFNSHNTRRLEVDELAQMLRGLPYVRAAMAGSPVDDL